MGADQIERQQRMAQMIEHAEEQHDVEPLLESSDLIDRQLAEFDVETVDLGGELRLVEIVLVEIDAEHPSGAAPLHLDGVEPAIAADVEHARAGKIGRQRMAELPPFVLRIVAEEMLGRGGDAAELDIVEPRPEAFDAGTDLVAAQLRAAHRRTRATALPARIIAPPSLPSRLIAIR